MAVEHSPVELIARGALGGLAVAALALAAVEDHEAIGTALVGAAVAFGLGAAFFDRVVEVSTSGVKLREYRALKKAAEREAPEADPEEKAELVSQGGEVLATKRSAGERITPDQAVREARLTWQRNALAVEMRCAMWLQERGWEVEDGVRSPRPPDLIARKGSRLAVIEIKTSAHPIGLMAVHQVLAQVASVEDAMDRGDHPQVVPVLVLGEIGLTAQAAQAAAERLVSVYQLDAENKFRHLSGPELED